MRSRDNVDKMEQRKENRQKRRNRFFTVLFSILFCTTTYYVSGLDYFNIDNYAIVNNEHYSDEEILRMSGVIKGANMFRVRISPWRDKLLKDPYIQSAKIKRTLPNGIKISVVERKEKALVSLDEKYVIIDGEGIALKEIEESNELPILKGLEMTEIILGEKLEFAGSDYDKCLTILSKTEESNIDFMEIDLSGIIVTIKINDKLSCKSDINNAVESIDNIKNILLKLEEDKIERGTIQIGSNGYLAFSPKTMTNE